MDEATGGAPFGSLDVAWQHGSMAAWQHGPSRQRSFVLRCAHALGTFSAWRRRSRAYIDMYIRILLSNMLNTFPILFF